MKTLKNTIGCVHLGGRTYELPERIAHLQSDSNYTFITLKNGEKFLSSTTLKIIEGRLAAYENFVRVNRKTMVNLEAVVLRECSIVVLPDNTEIKFSRRRQKLVGAKKVN